MSLSLLEAYFSSLAPLAPGTFQFVAALFREAPLKKYDYFALEGRVEKRIGFLTEGVVRAFYRTSDGAEYNKHFFTAPSLIGAYSSLISGSVNQINQQALTDCMLWTADYQELTRLYAAHPELERIGRRNAELAFVEKEQREIDIVLLDADKRYENFRKNFPDLEQVIPQYQIASYLGITPTQLSRIRQKMLRL